MNYGEQEHITLLRDNIKRFIDKELSREHAIQLDKDCTFSMEIFKKLCSLGVTGTTIPEEYGGTGVDILAAIVTIEELCKRGTSLAGPFIHCAFYGGMNIAENGSAEQKQKYLPELAKGNLFFAYGLSEPDVGGDLSSVSTSADEKDGFFYNNGTKRWCTGARFSDYILTLVRSGPKEEKYKNLSLIIIPTNIDGITITDIDHLGLRYGSTTDVHFDNVKVPLENTLGGIINISKGWEQLSSRALDVEKLEITAVAFGIACAAVEDAWNYAQERKQFGKLISAHQSIRHALADVKTQLNACRHMLYHGAYLANLEQDCAIETSMAKLFVGEASVDIVLKCQRILGAYGCASEYDMERNVRDIVLMPIVGGSSNMQRNNIVNRLKLSY